MKEDRKTQTKKTSLWWSTICLRSFVWLYVTCSTSTHTPISQSQKLVPCGRLCGAGSGITCVGAVGGEVDESNPCDPEKQKKKKNLDIVLTLQIANLV